DDFPVPGRPTCRAGCECGFPILPFRVSVAGRFRRLAVFPRRVDAHFRPGRIRVFGAVAGFLPTDVGRPKIWLVPPEVGGEKAPSRHSVAAALDSNPLVVAGICRFPCPKRAGRRSILVGAAARWPALPTKRGAIVFSSADGDSKNGCVAAELAGDCPRPQPEPPPTPALLLRLVFARRCALG